MRVDRIYAKKAILYRKMCDRTNDQGWTDPAARVRSIAVEDARYGVTMAQRRFRVRRLTPDICSLAPLDHILGAEASTVPRL